MTSFILDYLAGKSNLISFIVGAGGVSLFLYFAYRGTFLRNLVPRIRSSPPVLRGIIAGAEPEIALERAISQISSGGIVTLGELVFYFRGSKNEKVIRLDGALCAYIQRILDAKTTSLKVPPTFYGNSRAREMLRQLCRCTEQAARLEEERATSFDAANPEHMQLLRELWVAAGKSPAQFLHHSEEWSAFGFQGLDPATDLRGGGVLALRQFVDFAQTHNDEFREMLAFNKEMLATGRHSWYLLAVVSIQFTAQLLLQQYHSFYLPQLEVLYDTIKVSGDDGAGRYVGTARPAVLRRCREKKEATSACGGEGSDTVWEAESDFEVGFYTLHHHLLRHFKICWHRDLPHVMEYGNYIPTVFDSFFVRERV